MTPSGPPRATIPRPRHPAMRRLPLQGFAELLALARGETGHGLRRADATSRKNLVCFDRPISGQSPQKIADSRRAEKGRRVLYEGSRIRLTAPQLFFEMAAGRPHFIGPDKCLCSLLTGLLRRNDALSRHVTHRRSLRTPDQSSGKFTSLPKEAPST